MASTGKKSATPASNPFPQMPPIEDFGKLLGSLRIPGVDLAALAEWQRKDAEALAAAGRQTFDGIKAVIERRNQILQDTFAQWQAALQDRSANNTMAQQAQAASQGMEQAIAHIRELYDMELQTSRNAWKVVQDRLAENFANLQALLQAK